ncbi:MAG: RNA polymerase sigma factor RpoD/SigA [Clostridiales bacterium]|nr:RNA polymerase sigma factor RpoD/SigA [Clostridiales bacterium]MCF8021611.1 RNA polymerase sigma factor RpoD/SigA [Clostridiales bacterium]
MKSLEKIYKLRDFEQRFPDKTFISLEDAKNYLEKVIGRKIEEEHVRSYLLEKGYQKIYIPSNIDDDLDLEDIVNMDWIPRRTVKRESYAENTLLLQNFHTGKNSKVAFDRLVTENLKLVHKLAVQYKNYINHQLTYDDIVSEGVIGLIKAVKKFDINKDIQFSTYAVWWIRQQILRAIIDTGTTIRIPVHMFESIMKIKRAELSYLLNGQNPDIKEICNQLDISLDKYDSAKLIEHQLLGITSIDQPISTEEQDSELIDFLSLTSSRRLVEGYHSNFNDPLLLVEQSDVLSRIRTLMIKKLKSRDQKIIMERFGFLNNIPKTLEQIGEQYGLTRERIRQLEARALKKLKASLEKNIEDFNLPEL